MDRFESSMRNIGSTKEVLKRAELERLKPKPKPVIVVGRKKQKEEVVVIIEADYNSAINTLNHIQEGIREIQGDIKSKLIRDTILEENKVRTERNILSSQIWKMVENGATQDELKAHYQKIESYRPTMVQLWDRKRYVEVHGVLPEEQTNRQPATGNQQPNNVLELKDRKRKLSDLRCKLNKKLQPSAKPSSPAQIIDWQIQLDRADVEYHLVEEQIKQMQLK